MAKADAPVDVVNEAIETAEKTVISKDAKQVIYLGPNSAELGLSMSAAFTVFAKKVGREKRIPFEVSVDPFYSDSNIRYLENIVRDIKDGKAHFAEHDLIELD